MAEAYWRYTDSGAGAARYPQPGMGPPPQAAPPMKRPRTDYPDMAAGPEMVGYYPGDDGRSAHHGIRDTDSINASYDRYLRNGIPPPYGSGESLRQMGGMPGGLPGGMPSGLQGGMPGRPVEDLRMLGVGDGRSVGVGGGRPEPLPSDASNTVFVEGLPSNCTRREVSHIFRPFVGFREVRLVNKESRRPGGDPLILCFVDFENANQAAVALDALQGYVFDQHDRDCGNLRLQFARFPGPRSGGSGPKSGGGGSGQRSGGGSGQKSGGGSRGKR